MSTSESAREERSLFQTVATCWLRDAVCWSRFVPNSSDADDVLGSSAITPTPATVTTLYEHFAFHSNSFPFKRQLMLHETEIRTYEEQRHNKVHDTMRNSKCHRLFKNRAYRFTQTFGRRSLVNAASARQDGDCNYTAQTEESRHCHL